MGVLIKKINRFDIATFQWCMSRKYSPHIAAVSRWISHAGDGIYYLIIGLLLALLEPYYGPDLLVTGLIVFSIELPIYLTLKNLIKRKRPSEAIHDFVAILIPSDKFSFPSGHTAAGFVMATLIYYYYPPFTIVAYSLATVIGISRVLIGVHFPSDIVAGALLGIICTSITILYFG